MSFSALKLLSCLAFGAAILFGTPTSIATTRIATARRAATRRARPARSAAPVELEIQVLLDRAGFSPGEIDARGGKNAREALASFEAEHGFASGARSRSALLKALGASGVKPIVPYTITHEDTAGPLADAIPKDPEEQSQLPGLYYTSVLERLGEKFHSAPALLKRLNPRARFREGEHIRVPNVLRPEEAPEDVLDEDNKPDEGNKAEPASTQHGQPARERAGKKIVVSKNASSLKVYDAQDKLIFYAPVTSGSEHDPLPIGNWMVTSVVRNPTFNYNPDLFWEADPAKAKAKIAAGPNNPVGVIWIGINVPHYGIHGTPEPGRIGHSASHGCVRMTNWDVRRLAHLVTKGTPVVFQE